MTWRLGPVLAASVLASLAGGAAGAAEASRDPRVTACVDAAQREDYETVVPVCNLALPAASGKPETVAIVHALIGAAHLHLKQYDTSIEQLSMALRHAQAEHVRAQLYFDRGAANYHAGHHRRALIDYGNALRLAPRRAEIHFERGRSFVALDDPVRAERHFEAAATLDKNDKDYQEALQALRPVAQARRNAPWVEAAPSPQTLANTRIAIPRQSISADTEKRLMQELKIADERRRREIIDDIKRDADLYPPLVFYLIANIEWLLGEDDEAVFWWQAGELRASYDVARSADKSAGAAVGLLRAWIDEGIKRHMVERAGHIPALVERVLAFDERTGFGYDHRWINAHGLYAMLSPDAPTSLPEREWPTLHAEARSQWSKEILHSVPELLRMRDE